MQQKKITNKPYRPLPKGILAKSQYVLVNLSNKLKILVTHMAYPRKAIVDDVLVRTRRREVKEIHIDDLHRNNTKSNIRIKWYKKKESS